MSLQLQIEAVERELLVLKGIIESYVPLVAEKEGMINQLDAIIGIRVAGIEFLRSTKNLVIAEEFKNLKREISVAQTERKRIKLELADYKKRLRGMGIEYKKLAYKLEQLQKENKECGKVIRLRNLRIAPKN